jgi:secondary thiamine-phosphate synthase enzyme
MSHQRIITVKAPAPGLFDITGRVREVVDEANMRCGMCHIFVQHTSCSLVIQENADPSARKDLEEWLARLAPENDPLYTHTLEGPDDMPAHLRAAITHTSESIPIVDGSLGLGTWQGIYLWEHRRLTSPRQIVLTLMGE